MPPTRLARNHRYFQHSLGAWVHQFVDDFPWFDLSDIAETIGNKTSLPVTEKDFQVIEAQFMRKKLRAWTSTPTLGE